jgi:hypothetical protein
MNAARWPIGRRRSKDITSPSRRSRAARAAFFGGRTSPVATWRDVGRRLDAGPGRIATRRQRFHDKPARHARRGQSFALAQFANAVEGGVLDQHLHGRTPGKGARRGSWTAGIAVRRGETLERAPISAEREAAFGDPSRESFVREGAGSHCPPPTHDSLRRHEPFSRTARDRPRILRRANPRGCLHPRDRKQSRP